MNCLHQLFQLFFKRLVEGTRFPLLERFLVLSFLEFFSGIVMAMMTSDQIDHLRVVRDVAIPNSSELIHLSHSDEVVEFRFS